MTKGFWMSVLQGVIRTACVSVTGVTVAAITNMAINQIIKEKQIRPIGFVALNKNS